MSLTLTEFLFQVDSTFVVKGHAYVLARSLSAEGAFQVVEGSTLGGHPIEVFVDIPRTLDEHGKQRVDVFVFALRQPEAMRDFSEGDFVVLRAESAASRDA